MSSMAFMTPRTSLARSMTKSSSDLRAPSGSWKRLGLGLCAVAVAAAAALLGAARAE